MKKRIFIIFLLICLLYAIQSCDDEESNASKSACLKSTLKDWEKEEFDGFKPDACCFIDDGEDQWCSAVQKSKTKEFIEYVKKNDEGYNKDSKISIDCKSSYIKFIKYGIILLLLFLS